MGWVLAVPDSSPGSKLSSGVRYFFSREKVISTYIIVVYLHQGMNYDLFLKSSIPRAI